MYQKLCFPEVAILYISCSNLRSTRASSSLTMVSSSFEFRNVQHKIQQKFVLQIRLIPLIFCVNIQHATPKCLPRTNREVRRLLLECITRSPFICKVSNKNKHNLAFIVLRCLKVSIHALMALAELFQFIWFPRRPYGLFFIRDPHMTTNMFAPRIPSRIQSFRTWWRKYIYTTEHISIRTQ